MFKFKTSAVYTAFVVLYFWLTNNILERVRKIYGGTDKSVGFILLYILIPLVLGVLLGMRNLIRELKNEGGFSVDVIQLGLLIVLVIPLFVTNIASQNTLYVYCTILGYFFTTVLKKKDIKGRKVRYLAKEIL